MEPREREVKGLGSCRPRDRGKSRLRRLPVKSYAHGLELCLEESSLLGFFRGVQHHQDEMACLGSRYHLPAAALSFCGALDDPGQVQELNLCPAVLENAGDGRQRRKGV